jgi:hydrogenase expression/formation protein HypE
VSSEPAPETERVQLEHGSGGALGRKLVEGVIWPRFRGAGYRELADAACLHLSGEIVFTTDTYVVDPLFFPGGDIGRLAVFGTCNDVSVSGGAPRFLSVALVIEEGLPLGELEAVLDSMAAAAREAGVEVVTGDTKVVPAGRGGRLFVNTSGVGPRACPCELSPRRIEPGDRVLVSGPLGAHGLSVLAAREGLPVGAAVRSDCALLHPLCERLFGLGRGLRFARDATRGGLAAVLNEACTGGSPAMLIDEAAIPVDRDVAAAAGILGLDPLEMANEGVLVAVVAAECAAQARDLLRETPAGKRASIAGTVSGDRSGRVVLETRAGGRRYLDSPRGLLLPRIC